MVDFKNLEKGTIIISRFSEIEYYFRGVIKTAKGYFVLIQPLDAKNIYDVDIDTAKQIFRIKE